MTPDTSHGPEIPRVSLQRGQQVKGNSGPFAFARYRSGPGCAMLGGGGIDVPASAVLGGGGRAEQEVSAVVGGGGMADPDHDVRGGGGIAEQASAVVGGGGI